MPDDEVIIVGDDGTEHVFPAGFNPKRAAAIVRGGSPTLPTRPVSAEDFAPKPKGWPATLADVAIGFGKRAGSSLAGIGEMAAATGQFGMMPSGNMLDANFRNPRSTRIDELMTPTNDAQTVGSRLETVAELAGPAAAAVKSIPAVVRAALPAARKVLPAVAKALQSETSLITQARQAAARKVLGEAGAMAERAMAPAVAAEPTPVNLRYGRESGRLGFGYEPSPLPPAAPAPPAASPNAGGRVVPPQTPTAEQALADVVAEARTLPVQSPPARITTPPQPSLPPGFTPRTTVPKPKMAKAAMPAEHVAEPDAPPKRAYFLRSPEEVAAIQARKMAAAASTASEVIEPSHAIESLDKRIPKASHTTVDGLAVGKDIPNLSSIESSLDDYHELGGVREIPMDMFDPQYKPKPYSASESKRLDNLTEQIKANKRIDPLIVVFDSDKHPYILEGGHRFDALRNIGAKSVPAKIVIDTSEDAGAHLSPAIKAARGKVKPSDITDPAQIPEAWRSRMGPPELPKPRKPATKVTSAQIDELAKGLTDSGLSAREAIRRISKDSSMSAETRVRLMTALGKLAKAGAAK